MTGSKLRWQRLLLSVCILNGLSDLRPLAAQTHTGNDECAHEGCHLPVGHSLPLPFDSQAVWMHGRHQRPSSYAGYSSFRPYNFRHVAAQARIASVWPTRSGSPYALIPFSPPVYTAVSAVAQQPATYSIADRNGTAEAANVSLQTRSNVQLRVGQSSDLRPVPQSPVHVYPNSIRSGGLIQRIKEARSVYE